MKERITRDDFSRMMAGAAAQIRERHSLLSQLDSVAGDGDHGATMVRAASCLEKAFSPDGSASLKTSFHQAGWDILNADGGASTSLLGAFFLGMSDAVADDMAALDCAGLAAVFQSGLSAVQKQTKAQPGDKTMMDALVPAVESLKASAAKGEEIETALAVAATAASAGAAGTKDLIARYGRARQLGEKTRGYPDPGATSIALIFEGLCNGLAEAEGEQNYA